VPIVGGDVSHQRAGIVATLTLVGEASGPRILTRRGARAGDWIYVTGELGGSLPSRHHFRFTPRLAEGAWLARRAEVRAMMDVSDGLAKDLHALTPRVQCRRWPRSLCPAAAAARCGRRSATARIMNCSSR